MAILTLVTLSMVENKKARMQKHAGFVVVKKVF
jgi:hypothetical protein